MIDVGGYCNHGNYVGADNHFSFCGVIFSSKMYD